MKSMLKLLLALALSLSFGAAFAAAPATLTLNDLRNNPERWPATVTVPKELKFQSGKTLKKGETVKVVELQGNDVVVDAGNDFVFTLPLAESDFVVKANEAWATLTPAQREIDAAVVVKDSSLWPLRVKASAEFRLNNGTVLKAGTEYELLSVARDGVSLYAAQYNASMKADFKMTDLIERARALVLIPAEKRPSRIAAVLRGQLVDASGKASDPADLEATQIFALYYGASWCPPCRKFSPDLVKFINEVAPKNPHLTVVLMSNDKSDAEMYGYMNAEKMPWVAMPLSKINGVPLLTGYTKGGIPQLVIVDRQGKVLADSYRGAAYVGPQVAMQGLGKILETGVAK